MENPVLTLVPHFRAGTCPVAIGRMPADETAALLACFTDSGVATEDARERAMCVLARIGAHALWLACSCRGAALGQAPILYPQRTRSGGRTLVRNYDRSAHDEACPFARLRALPPTPDQAPPSAVADDFAILRVARSSPRDNDVPAGDGVRGSQALPRLARILFRLLVEARLDEIPAAGMAYRPAPYYEALRAAISTHSLDGPGKIPLSEVCFTSARMLDRLRRTLSSRELVWTPPLVPQGFLIFKVDDVAGQTLIASRGDTVEVHGAITRFGATTPGPYLAIVLVGQDTPGSGPVVPVRAYVHPLFEPWSLLPVDSDLERHTLHVLLGLQRWLREAKGVAVSLRKPIADVIATPGVHVRPDFILTTTSGAQLCVETMGYTDAAYLEQKARTHSQMAALVGPVIKHHAGGDTELRRAVTQAVLRAGSGRGSPGVSISPAPHVEPWRAF